MTLVHLIRRSIVLVVCMGIYLLSGILSHVAIAQIPEPPLPPTNVTATANASGQVVITWSNTGGQGPLGGYKVYRNATRLAQLVADGQGGPTSYTDPNPPDGPVAYAVTSYDAIGQEGPASPEAVVQPVAPAPSPPEPGQDDSSSDLGGGGLEDLKGPQLQGNNAPTTFETYGAHSARVHETYGISDAFIKWAMLFPTTGWYLAAKLNYIALTLLAWVTTDSFYTGLIKVVDDFVQTMFHLSVYASLMYLAALIGLAFLVVYFAKGRHTLVMRGFVVMLLGIFLATVYLTESHKIVTTLMAFPIQAGQYVLSYAGELMTIPDDNNFGLSIKPTYNGDSAEQGLRQFQEMEYLNGQYQGMCKLNFGDVNWATTNYVPNHDQEVVAAGFDNLTYCEYYVRSVMLNMEDDYLTSQVEEHAPPEVWRFFQGQNFMDHAWFAFLLVVVTVFRSALIFMLTLSFVVGVIYIGLGLIKLTLLVFGWLIPPAQPVVNRTVMRMSTPALWPVYVALLAIISLAFSAAGPLLYQPFGWTGMMVYQFAVALTVLIASLWFWRFRKQAHGSDKPPSPTRQRLVQAGTSVATGVATGGTKVAATVAAKTASTVRQWNRRRWVPPDRSSNRSV